MLRYPIGNGGSVAHRAQRLRAQNRLSIVSSRPLFDQRGAVMWERVMKLIAVGKA